MAHYGLILSLRPSGYPQFGGEMEGFFGEFVKQWLCQRPGNLADYKEVRSVDGSKAPKKAAILQPVDFYQELWAFCEWRENKCREREPIQSRSPLWRGRTVSPSMPNPLTTMLSSSP